MAASDPSDELVQLRAEVAVVREQAEQAQVKLFVSDAYQAVAAA